MIIYTSNTTLNNYSGYKTVDNYPGKGITKNLLTIIQVKKVTKDQITVV